MPPAKRASPTKKACNEEMARELWNLSEQLVKENCGTLS